VLAVVVAEAEEMTAAEEDEVEEEIEDVSAVETG
jgi:hypothetical protein